MGAPSSASLYPHPQGSERFVKFRDIRMMTKLLAHPLIKGDVLAISANDIAPNGSKNSAVKVLSYMLATDAKTRELLYKRIAAEVLSLKPNQLQRNKQRRTFRPKDRTVKSITKSVKGATVTAKQINRKSVGRASLAHIAWLSKHGFIEEGGESNKKNQYPTDIFDHCEI